MATKEKNKLGGLFIIKIKEINEKFLAKKRDSKMYLLFIYLLRFPKQ